MLVLSGIFVIGAFGAEVYHNRIKFGGFHSMKQVVDGILEWVRDLCKEHAVSQGAALEGGGYEWGVPGRGAPVFLDVELHVDEERVFNLLCELELRIVEQRDAEVDVKPRPGGADDVAEHEVADLIQPVERCVQQVQIAVQLPRKVDAELLGGVGDDVLYVSQKLEAVLRVVRRRPLGCRVDVDQHLLRELQELYHVMFLIRKYVISLFIHFI